MAADEAAEESEIREFTAPRAEECRRSHRQRLLRETGHGAADALHGLAESGAADGPVESALRGPLTGLVSAALDVIEQKDDPRWCPQLFALLSRVEPAGPPPAPSIRVRSVKFLLRHGHRADEVRGELPRAGGTGAGEAVLLALEHAPEHALPLVRKALLSDIPINRSETAAILAVINRPWGVRELLNALGASDDQEKTADVRAALLETGDARAERAVQAWEERNPHEAEAGSYLEVGGRKLGPFYTFGEISSANRAALIRYEMDKLRDRVMRVKDVIPPEPPGPTPWWNFRPG